VTAFEIGESEAIPDARSHALVRTSIVLFRVSVITNNEHLNDILTDLSSFWETLAPATTTRVGIHTRGPRSSRGVDMIEGTREISETAVEVGSRRQKRLRLSVCGQ
jgi:hypothetical protein